MDRPSDSQAATYAATLPTDGCVDTLPGLPIEDAARALGVSSSTIRRWVREGRLRSEKVARPQGYTVRVHLPDHASGQLSDQPPTRLPEQQVAAWAPEQQRAEAMATYSRSLLEPLVAELGEARRQIAAQAETIGSLRAQLAAAEAPKEPEPAPVPEPSAPDPSDPLRDGQESPEFRPTVGRNSAPWWRRWWLTLAGGGLALVVVASSCGASAEHPELCAAARDAMDVAAASVDLAINWTDTLSAVTVADEVC